MKKHGLYFSYEIRKEKKQMKRKKAEHEVKYEHTPYMSIMNCTGDNCRFA